MRETLERAGIETAAGDMHEELPGGPFDAVYFGNTSHMYGPEENRASSPGCAMCWHPAVCW
jgi:hypothetical protein